MQSCYCGRGCSACFVPGQRTNVSRPAQRANGDAGGGAKAGSGKYGDFSAGFCRRTRIWGHSSWRKVKGEKKKGRKRKEKRGGSGGEWTSTVARHFYTVDRSVARGAQDSETTKALLQHQCKVVQVRTQTALLTEGGRGK